MRNKKQGFTLVEILIAMAVLAVGLVGILSLFPVGLNATRKAIEDTNAALLAESVYASLRTAAQKTPAGGNLVFFYDGIDKTKNSFPKGGAVFNETSLRDKAFGIPSHKNGTNAPLAIAAYIPSDLTEKDYCHLGRGKETGATSNKPYDIIVTKKDQGQIEQYSFNIQLSYPTVNPKSLYDVTIRIRRNKRLIKKFYTQIMIPTGD